MAHWAPSVTGQRLERQMQRATGQTARKNRREALIEAAIRPVVAQHGVTRNRQHVKLAISPWGL